MSRPHHQDRHCERVTPSGSGWQHDSQRTRQTCFCPVLHKYVCVMKSMLPQQPCVDNYGHNICHLQRFHLLDKAPMRRSAPPVTPSPVTPSRPATTFVPGVIGSDTVPNIPTRPSRGPGRGTLIDLEGPDPVIYTDVVQQPSSAVPGRVKATIKTAPMTNDEFTAAWSTIVLN